MCVDETDEGNTEGPGEENPEGPGEEEPNTWMEGVDCDDYTYEMGCVECE